MQISRNYGNFAFSAPHVENFSDKIKACVYIFVCYRCAQIKT